MSKLFDSSEPNQRKPGILNSLSDLERGGGAGGFGSARASRPSQRAKFSSMDGMNGEQGVSI